MDHTRARLRADPQLAVAVGVGPCMDHIRARLRADRQPAVAFVVGPRVDHIRARLRSDQQQAVAAHQHIGTGPRPDHRFALFVLQKQRPSANFAVIRRRPHHRDSTDTHHHQQQGVTVSGCSAFQFGYSLFQVHWVPPDSSLLSMFS